MLELACLRTWLARDPHAQLLGMTSIINRGDALCYRMDARDSHW